MKKEIRVVTKRPKRITPFGFIEESYEKQMLFSACIIILYASWNICDALNDLSLKNVQGCIRNIALSIPVALVFTSIVFEGSLVIIQIGRFFIMLSNLIRDWIDKKENVRDGRLTYEGEVRKQQEWEEWNRKRIIANREGEVFETPPPSPPVEPEDN